MIEKKGTDSALKLFDRPYNIKYLEEWEAIISEVPEAAQDYKEIPVVVFRLGDQWFGLAVNAFLEIATLRKINTIPHKTDPVILGIVNLRGQLRICFSLHKLLDVEESVSLAEDRVYYSRLVAISCEEGTWTFVVNEVDSIYTVDFLHLSNIPVNISLARENYLKGVAEINDRKVYIIDEEMLFNSLKRRLS